MVLLGNHRDVSSDSSDDSDNSDNSESDYEDTMPKPDRILFQSSLMKERDDRICCLGLKNFQVTCYVNSVIQCLQYIPVWRNYVCHQHIRECNLRDKCLACQLRIVAIKSQCLEWPFLPVELLRILENISSTLSLAIQQDAHEFLICLLGKLQEQTTSGLGKLEPCVEMTTAVGQIFGGFLRSQIVCAECQGSSDSFEEFFHLSLDIDGVDDMEDAMSRFMAADSMGNEEWYGCQSCNRKTRASRHYDVHRVPEVLVVHLKRYDTFGTKLCHFVSFPEVFDLGAFATDAVDRAGYILSGVIVHYGISLLGGHYVAFVRDPGLVGFSGDTVWYCIDDESIVERSYEDVEQLHAYMLFYERISTEEEGEVEYPQLLKLMNDRLHSSFMNWNRGRRQRRRRRSTTMLREERKAENNAEEEEENGEREGEENSGDVSSCNSDINSDNEKEEKEGEEEEDKEKEDKDEEEEEEDIKEEEEEEIKKKKILKIQFVPEVKRIQLSHRLERVNKCDESQRSISQSPEGSDRTGEGRTVGEQDSIARIYSLSHSTLQKVEARQTPSFLSSSIPFSVSPICSSFSSRKRKRRESEDHYDAEICSNPKRFKGANSEKRSTRAGHHDDDDDDDDDSCGSNLDHDDDEHRHNGRSTGQDKPAVGATCDPVTEKPSVAGIDGIVLVVPDVDNTSKLDVPVSADDCRCPDVDAIKDD